MRSHTWTATEWFHGVRQGSGCHKSRAKLRSARNSVAWDDLLHLILQRTIQKIQTHCTQFFEPQPPPPSHGGIWKFRRMAVPSALCWGTRNHSPAQAGSHPAWRAKPKAWNRQLVSLNSSTPMSRKEVESRQLPAGQKSKSARNTYFLLS